MNVPIFSQRDGRWAGQRLGTQDGATIGDYGCALTSVTMVDGAFDPNNVWTPAQVDDWFTAKGGYVDGAGHRSPQNGCDLLDWGAINSLLPNTQHAGADYTPNDPADIGKIRQWLDQGGLVILQVGFGGDANRMHFVAGVGYNGDDIIFNDPWYGDQASFASGRYGANSAAAINATHYMADTTPNTPPAPPEAPAPVPQPAPATPPPAEPPAPAQPPTNQSEAPEVSTDTPSQKPSTEDLQHQIDVTNERVSSLTKLVQIILDYLLKWKRFRDFYNKRKG